MRRSDPVDIESLLNDRLFEAQSERISAEDVFAASPEMISYIESNITAEQEARGRQQGLFDALYRKGGLKLDYDSTMTRNAAEAFAARSGNCLSLVVMTAAFAKQMDLGVRYQSVYTQEAWSRGENLNFLNGHVNVTLVFKPNASGHTDRRELQVDFIPIPEGEEQRIRVLTEETIVAAYMNNRAVELLAQGELDRAYWWARAAILQDTGYLQATNTLAVIYKKQGDIDEAGRALRWILDIEPDNTLAMDNMIHVLEAQGRDEEASQLASRLKAIRPVPPFYYFDLGLEAMRHENFAQAKAMFLKEVQRDANYDKFHASLALAYHGLGESAKAQLQMAIAVRTSTTTADRQLYSDKLARMKAGQPP